MLSVPLVVGASFAYLLLLFAVAAYGDARSRSGRSIIGNAWVYALSMAVYCTAWTYFGSVGRAASAGVWFLPIYLGPTLAMVLAWLTLRKMIRIAKTYRITSIADFIASRYGKSPLLAGAVTLITVVGIVPYIALQLKAVASGYALLTTPLGTPLAAPLGWWRDSTFYFALALAGFTMVFGARHLDSAEKHEGMVAAIAFESVVKLLAFMAVGAVRDLGHLPRTGRHLRARPRPSPSCTSCSPSTQGPGQRFAYEQWFALTLLSMLSVVFLPRQFQMMVVENVDERHLRRAAWVFPLYLLLINLFVLPIALGGLLHFGPGRMDADSFVLSLPLALGAAGAGPVRLRRRAVGGHRHGDRRGDRRLDHGLQRPGHADAAAHTPLRRARPRRPGPAASGYPAGRDRRRSAARLRLLRDRRRGLCAGQHRPHQLRRGGPVRAGDAGRAVLEGRHARRCAGRPAPRLRCSGPTP